VIAYRRLPSSPQTREIISTEARAPAADGRIFADGASPQIIVAGGK
jgi:hypothetical protein